MNGYEPYAFMWPRKDGEAVRRWAWIDARDAMQGTGVPSGVFKMLTGGCRSSPHTRHYESRTEALQDLAQALMEAT